MEVVVIENLKELFSLIPIITLIGFSVTFMKVIVNFINAHEIENLLKTPWKKFVDSFAISSLFSLIVIAFIISESNIKELQIEIINHTTEFTLLILSLYILLTFVLFMLGYFFVSLAKSLWNTNAYYLIDSDNDEWKIEKALDHNTVYVVRENLSKILKLDHSYSIKKVIVPNNKVQSLFDFLDKIKHFKLISLIIFSFLTLGLSSLFFLNINNKISLSIILIIILILLVIIVQGYNDYLYNKNSETNLEASNNSTEPSNFTNMQN